MKKGYYSLKELPRLSTGIPAVQGVGWMPDHIYYHNGLPLENMFICLILKEDSGESLSIVNGMEHRTRISVPRLSFVLPGTVIQTIQPLRRDELFFVYHSDSRSFWENYFSLKTISFKRTDYFEIILIHLFECLNELHTPGRADALDCLVLQILSEIRIQEKQKNEKPEIRIIQDIASHLIGHFSEPVDIAGLLRGRGLSQRSFYRLWKRLYLESPMEMLHAKRMSAAEHLLNTTELSIKEISELCGFCSTVYFYQSFRKSHHCSPSEYRNIGNCAEPSIIGKTAGIDF